MPMLKRPLSAFMLGACLFALSACDSKDEPVPDAGVTTDAGTEPDAGSTAVIPEGHTLLTPSATEVHSVPWESAETPLRFAFVPQAGHHYDLIVETGSDGYILRMRDGAGTSLDYGMPNRGVSSTPHAWHWSGLSGGSVHTVEVQWYSEYSEAPVAPFSFRFVDMGPDDHGDLLATATPYTPSAQVLEGHGEHWGERDLLSFQSVAGNIYALDCTFPTQFWSQAFLTSKGKLHAYAENGGIEPVFRGRITIKGLGGLSYAEIKDQGEAGASQPYRCILNDLGPEDHGNTVETATALPQGTSSVSGKVETLTDDDVFSLIVQPGHHYRATCTMAGLRLCDLSAAAPGEAFRSSNPMDRKRTAFKASQGTHFVRMHSEAGLATGWEEGNYTLQFEDLGADDHGDSLAAATPLTGPAQTVSVRIPDAADRDWFSFQATAGQRYQFGCDWKDSPGQVQLYPFFYDARGSRFEPPREHVGARWVFAFTASTSGTYGIDLGMDPMSFVLEDSTCQFEVLTP
ncbi:hypothetical protein ACQKGO_09390 [Corallococcus interemptor]|uniref:hypothetical protein n=1 Tax=Corallococcus interemptor TaxID=2316720 RepID=UPI003D0186F6